jgi:hypothetical protein
VKITFNNADVFTKALRAVSSAAGASVYIRPNMTTAGVVQSVDMLAGDGKCAHRYRFNEHEFTADDPTDACEYVLAVFKLPLDLVQLVIASKPQSVTLDTSAGSLNVVGYARVTELRAVVTTVHSPGQPS